MMAEFQPRPKQAEVLKYEKGLMGVSAVPGSGKTQTLSYLAAQLVIGGSLSAGQEVLIVTLVNSAVDNFTRRVGDFVQAAGLLPNVGYRVRTLHGLSNDIVRERPALVGLSEDFQIIDEREADAILQDAALAWVRSHPESYLPYLEADLTENEVNKIERDHWQRSVVTIAGNFIKQAKDLRLTPDDIRRKLDETKLYLPLADMGWEIYVAYQRSLTYRGAVDFQDLIRLALAALEADEKYLERLKQKWPYILEDEAQDSSLLQQAIIEKLAGKRGNWVRVGDPNQAIYETFTTASPDHLRRFLAKGNVKSRELPNSGRSTRSIIALANHLMDWTGGHHPVTVIRQSPPLQPPHILPTPKGDPQPNPKNDPSVIHLRPENYSPAGEIEAVVKSVRQWLPENMDKTCVVLVPRNDRGSEIVKALTEAGLEVVELLRSTSTTRQTAGALSLILDHLSQPVNPPSLAKVYNVWRRDDRDNVEMQSQIGAIARVLRGCRQVEDFVWPRVDHDWLDTTPEVIELMDRDEAARDEMLQFRSILQRWQNAVILPIDQLILTLGQDLLHDPVELAIAHNLAVLMRHDADANPGWRLPQFAQQLKDVARNRRRVTGMSEDDTGFDPDAHQGKVTVTTMHRAKGLEWDRVYLMSVNNYNFPSLEPGDTYISEKWFVRDDLNLEAEALAQLNVLAGEGDGLYEEGIASEQARIEYVSERLRLLYVGITRARRELVMTWNTGRDGKRTQAVPFIALQAFWEKQRK